MKGLLALCSMLAFLVASVHAGASHEPEERADPMDPMTLYYAAHLGQVALMEFLSKAGANIDFRPEPDFARQ